MQPRLFDPDAAPDDGSHDTVGGVVSLYLAHLRARRECGDFSRHAYSDTARELERFCKLHGLKRLDECRRRDLTLWIESHPQWRSPWTRKRIMATLVRPFIWAEDQELIAYSPYRAPKRMRQGRKRRPATDSEYVALMRGGSRELRRSLFFMRRTGCRTKEVRELRWVDIDFVRGVIVIEEHKTIGQQNEPLPRTIGLEPATLRFLRNLHRKRRAGQINVFVNCDGKSWDRHTFARHMHRWATRLGLDPTASRLSPYCFRHTYGTNAIEAGVGERQLADLMGHTTTRMVSYYAQTAGKVEHLKRNAAAALQRKRK